MQFRHATDANIISACWVHWHQPLKHANKLCAPMPMQVGQTPVVLRARRLRDDDRTKPVPLQAWHLRSHTYMGTCEAYAVGSAASQTLGGTPRLDKAAAWHAHKTPPSIA